METEGRYGDIQGWREEGSEGGRGDETDSCPSSMSCMSVKSCPPMPGTADGGVISSCQILGRAGSVHHGTDPYLLHGLLMPVTSFLFVGKSPLQHVHS